MIGDELTAGDFACEGSILEDSLKSIEMAAQAGAYGIALGPMCPDGSVDLYALRMMTDRA